MRKLILWISAFVSLIFATSAFGQAAPADTTATNQVTSTMKIDQPTLFDTTKLDTFNTTVDDVSGTTNLTVVCSAGKTRFFVARVDTKCAITGDGFIKNPANISQTARRLSYLGGYVVDSHQDGLVDMSTVQANYQQVGPAAGMNSSFKGMVQLKPEHPGQSASALADSILAKAQQAAAGTTSVTVDQRFDSIKFDNLVVPGAGGKGSMDCSWKGDLVYPYATNIWQGILDITCGQKTYHLAATIPLSDTKNGDDSVQTYQVNLVVPGAASADPFAAAADPFAAVDGVKGTFTLKNSGRAKDGVYQNVDVSGSLTGTNVPLELTRGWAEIMNGLLARTFYGA